MCTLYRTEYPGGLGMSVVGWRLWLHPGSYTACVPQATGTFSGLLSGLWLGLVGAHQFPALCCLSL